MQACVSMPHKCVRVRRAACGGAQVDIDISCNQVAAYVTGLVRGATKSLVIDMGFVLEGEHAAPRTARSNDC